MKTARAIVEWLALIAVLTVLLCAAAAVLAPVDIAHPQPTFRSTT
jgi:hypothetical protein